MKSLKNNNNSIGGLKVIKLILIILPKAAKKWIKNRTKTDKKCTPKMAKTEKFMFQNVVYKPTVYKTGILHLGLQCAKPAEELKTSN